MSRKPFAAIGLSAVAAVGVSLASHGMAYASPAVPMMDRPLTVTLSGLRASTIGTASRKISPRPTTYTVRPGDSLWAIGQRYDVSMTALAAANQMQLSDILQIGRVLTLPGPGPSSIGPAPAATITEAAASARSTRDVSSSATAHASYSGSEHASYSAPSSSLEQCVISRESGGNSQARNGAYWGLFQFSRSTWAAYGGNTRHYGQASAGEQQQVFNNAVARGGASNWTPYDGC